MFHVVIARFSVYYNNPQKYGIKNIKPIGSYLQIFPDSADINKLAFLFIADYDAETYVHYDIISKLLKQVEDWHSDWNNFINRPRLMVLKKSNNHYDLLDSRKLSGTQYLQTISEKKARAILLESPYKDNHEQQWAIKNKLALYMNDHYIPLATTTEELMDEFIAE